MKDEYDFSKAFRGPVKEAIKHFKKQKEKQMAKSKPTLNSLKKDFDKVLLKHDIEGRRTVAVLVKGTNVYVGVAKIHADDTLNRPKGRLISLGRAVHASLVHNGTRQRREKELKREQPLAFTLETQTAENTEAAITDLFNGNFFL